MSRFGARWPAGAENRASDWNGNTCESELLAELTPAESLFETVLRGAS